VDGQGIVTSNPSGISCRDDCSAEFATGTTVTLTADPDTWWYLLSWGGACANTPANEPCVLDVTQNVTVTANFAAAPG